MGKWDWIRGYKTIRREATGGIVSASYTLKWCHFSKAGCTTSSDGAWLK